MEIRELIDEERDVAIRLWSEVGLTRPWNDPVADFDRALRGPTSAVLGAVDGADVVATVMVGHDGHRGWVYYLAVVSDRQGQGLGSRLMAAAEGWLLSAGEEKLNLMVRDTNAEAVTFYRRLGYEDAGATVRGRWLVEQPAAR